MEHGEQWAGFVKTLSAKTRASYEKEVRAFSEVMESSEHNIPKTLLLYFTSLHEKGVACSTLWKTHSILNTFLKMTEGFNLPEQVPLLTKQLKAWEKTAVKKKASIFTEEDYNTFLEAPNDYLSDKIIFITALHGLLRLTELSDLTVKSYRKLAPSVYELNSMPQKQVGPKQGAVHFVTGRKEIELLDTYLALFGPDDNDKLFRKLIWKNDQAKVINQNIGKNTLSDTGKRIARFLALENPETYTSHSFRRSAATKLADKGISTPALMKAGGWRSATVAQSYVGDSKTAKLEVANKLSASAAHTMTGGQIINVQQGAVVNYIFNNYQASKPEPTKLEQRPAAEPQKNRPVLSVLPIDEKAEKELFEEEPPPPKKPRTLKITSNGKTVQKLQYKKVEK